jgi:hypothetical protein
MFQSILNFFKKQKQPETPFTGAILPTQAEIDSIPKFQEIVVLASPVVWKTLDLQKLPTWIQYNQGFINKCVAATKALMDSIKFYKRNNLKREVKFSDDWIYYHRSPKIAGMVGTKAIDITREIGNIHDSLFPLCLSDADVDKAQIDKWMYDEAKIYQTYDTPILPPIKDIDTLVSIMQVTDKPIMVWFEFINSEWKAVPVYSGLAPTARHSTTFIPPKNPGEMVYGIYEGEKAIVIQDSWGLQYGINGKRIIKESYFKARNIFNQYDMRFKFDVSLTGEHYDGSMISLQRCLRSVGYFPTNISLVESFGPVTRSALMKWKIANGLNADSVLDETTKALLKVKF